MRKTQSNGYRSPMVKSVALSILSASMLISASTAQANNPPPTLKAEAPNIYVVKMRDTLWDISGRYLNNPVQWREIWAANKQVKNPHLIYPGDILLMCVIRGKTLIGIDTGEGCVGIERNMIAPPTSSQSVSITPLNNSISAIPLSAIEHWLDRVLVVNPKDYEATPYVLASKTGNLITAEGDKIYAKGVPLIVGQRYGIYREGEPYVDPRNNQVIGLEVQQVATGIVTNVANNNVSSIDLVKSYATEVREGDRVFVELTNDISPIFNLKAAHVNRGGQVVRVMGSINSAGKGSVVAVNLGLENNAQVGDVLTILKRGALIRDIRDQDAPVRLPNEQVGSLMLFKTFDKISYAYVLDTELPISKGDRVL